MDPRYGSWGTPRRKSVSPLKYRISFLPFDIARLQFRPRPGNCGRVGSCNILYVVPSGLSSPISIEELWKFWVLFQNFLRQAMKRNDLIYYHKIDCALLHKAHWGAFKISFLLTCKDFYLNERTWCSIPSGSHSRSEISIPRFSAKFPSTKFLSFSLFITHVFSITRTIKYQSRHKDDK